ncbi:hypothetical protein [uncultured Sphingomonas sp.]|uniref:hypothetical protein n=1 Tax=uncultured Sphingomonas sp. TaxID=158754 RepID=UPI0035CBA9AA
MKGRRRLGAPTAADLLRLRAARREARVAVAAAERRFADERTAAFRRELSATC